MNGTSASRSSCPARRVVAAVVACWIAVLAAGTAAAAQPDAETRNAARELARRGDALMRKHQCAQAVDLFRRAYSLVPAPTIELLRGRCLVELGRLIEAVESYETVIHTALAPDAPDAFRQAVTDARGELEALRPRVPHVKIVVSGPGADTAGVRIDGKALPRALVGVPAPIDPGPHEIDAGSASSAQKLDVVEGKSYTVALHVEGSPRPAPAPPQGDARGAESSPRGASHASQRTWGFVALGVGGAGLATGVVTALLAKGKQSSLDGECAGTRCPPSAQSDLDAFHTLRTTSIVAYAVGFVGAGAGAVLLFTSPKEQPRAGKLTPWVGPAAAGVRGTF